MVPLRVKTLSRSGAAVKHPMKSEMCSEPDEPGVTRAGDPGRYSQGTVRVSKDRDAPRRAASPLYSWLLARFCGERLETEPQRATQRWLQHVWLMEAAHWCLPMMSLLTDDFQKPIFFKTTHFGKLIGPTKKQQTPSRDMGSSA